MPLVLRTYRLFEIRSEVEGAEIDCLANSWEVFAHAPFLLPLIKPFEYQTQGGRTFGKFKAEKVCDDECASCANCMMEGVRETVDEYLAEVCEEGHLFCGRKEL